MSKTTIQASVALDKVDVILERNGVTIHDKLDLDEARTWVQKIKTAIQAVQAAAQPDKVKQIANLQAEIDTRQEAIADLEATP